MLPKSPVWTLPRRNNRRDRTSSRPSCTCPRICTGTNTTVTAKETECLSSLLAREGGLPRPEESEQEKGLEGEGCTGDSRLSKEVRQTKGWWYSQALYISPVCCPSISIFSNQIQNLPRALDFGDVPCPSTLCLRNVTSITPPIPTVYVLFQRHCPFSAFKLVPPSVFAFSWTSIDRFKVSLPLPVSTIRSTFCLSRPLHQNQFPFRSSPL
jgi:hypothetical protein